MLGLPTSTIWPRRPFSPISTLPLFGQSVHTSWRFSLAGLYPSPAMANHSLSHPFDMEEIAAALFAMDMDSSPGALTWLSTVLSGLT